jgi:lysophospholipase L1-like esterase
MDGALLFGIFLLLPLVSGGWLWLFARGVRKCGTPARWPRLLLGNFLVLLFLLSLLVAGGEAYYRFAYDNTDSLSFTLTSQRWFQRHWRLNSSDCRDNIDYAKRIKPGRRRISFVGDSFTAGHGIKDVESRFPNRIRRLHPEWEVHVLAKPGLDTGDELEYLNDLLAQNYQVDRVVLVYCLNDVGDLLPELIENNNRVRDEAKQSGWLWRKSYFANTLYCRFQMWRHADLKDYYQSVREGYQGPVWEEQKRWLTVFRDLIESHGGRLSVVTFPFLHAAGPNYEYQLAHDELDRFWRELKVPHLDLLPLYRNLPPKKITVNRFDAHPNEYAHALAAEAIEKFLSEQLVVKP